MKKNLYAFALILVVAVASGLLVHRKAPHVGPVMPMVGDTVYYRWGNHGFLCVRCTQAVGKKRTLEITCRRTGAKNWTPAYKVELDYQAKFDSPRRVMVIDASGHLIKSGDTNDGVPVPFHSLRFVPGDSVPCNLRINLSDGWGMMGFFWGRERRLKFHKTGQSYDIDLIWDANEWLWKSCYKVGEHEKRFFLERCNKPE